MHGTGRAPTGVVHPDAAAPGGCWPALEEELGRITRQVEGASARLQGRRREQLSADLSALRDAVDAACAGPKPPPRPALLRMLRAMRALRLQLDAAAAQDDERPVPAGYPLVVQIAHDLRAPLTSIVFLSDTLRMGSSGPVNPLQVRQLGLIYAAALGLVSLASDLIELTLDGDRLIDAEPVPFWIGRMLDSIGDLVRPISEERHVALRVLQPEVDYRSGHPAAISRVVLNLVTNALRHAENGFVEVAAQPAGPDLVEFSVRDNGPGLSAAARQSLFEPFGRPSGDRYGFSGSGLGLAISRRLVRAMGSDLRCETSPGQGARFSFILRLPPVSG